MKTQLIFPFSYKILTFNILPTEKRDVNVYFLFNYFRVFEKANNKRNNAILFFKLFSFNEKRTTAV